MKIPDLLWWAMCDMNETDCISILNCVNIPKRGHSCKFLLIPQSSECPMLRCRLCWVLNIFGVMPFMISFHFSLLCVLCPVCGNCGLCDGRPITCQVVSCVRERAPLTLDVPWVAQPAIAYHSTSPGQTTKQ